VPASGSWLLAVENYGCSVAGIGVSVSSGQVLAGSGEKNNRLQVSKLSVTFVCSGEVTRSAWTLSACGEK
jgi:hypothetical protein